MLFKIYLFVFYPFMSFYAETIYNTIEVRCIKKETIFLKQIHLI